MGDTEDQKLIDDYLSSVVERYIEKHNLDISENESNAMFSTLKNFINIKDVKEIELVKLDIKTEEERCEKIKNEMGAYWKMSPEDVIDDFLIEKGVSLHKNLRLNLDVLREVNDLVGLMAHILHILHTKGVESGFAFADSYISKINPQDKFGRLVPLITKSGEQVNFQYALMGLWNDKNDPAMAAGMWTRYALEKYVGNDEVKNETSPVSLGESHKRGRHERLEGLGEHYEYEKNNRFSYKTVNTDCKQTRALCVGTMGSDLAKGKHLIKYINSILLGMKYSFFENLNPRKCKSLNENNAKEYFLKELNSNKHIINLMWEMTTRKELNLMTLFPYLEIALYANIFLAVDKKRIEGAAPPNSVLSLNNTQVHISDGYNKYKLICEQNSCIPCPSHYGHNAHSLGDTKIDEKLELVHSKVRRQRYHSTCGCFPLSNIQHLPFCIKIVPVLTDLTGYRSSLVENLTLNSYDNNNVCSVSLIKEKFQNFVEVVNLHIREEKENILMDGFIRKPLEEIRTQAKLEKKSLENVVNDYIRTLSELAYHEKDLVTKDISRLARWYFTGVQNKTCVKYNRKIINMTRPLRIASGSVISSIFTKSQGLFCQKPASGNYNVYTPHHSLIVCSMSMNANKNNCEKKDICSILKDGGKGEINKENEEEEEEEEEKMEGSDSNIVKSMLDKIKEQNRGKKRQRSPSEECCSEDENDDLYEMKSYSTKKTKIFGKKTNRQEDGEEEEEEEDGEKNNSTVQNYSFRLSSSATNNFVDDDDMDGIKI